MLRPQQGPAPASGWRRVVHQLSGGRVQPGPSASEQAREAMIARVRVPVSGTRRIAVVSRKGGVGKTTTTLMLGHSLAWWRGDRVVAVDGNPDAGSLGYRVAKQTDATVSDLLADRDQLRTYGDVRRFTSQAPSRLEVVAADDDPQLTEALGETEYRAAVALLERHYNLILLDTGTGILDNTTKGILAVADQLIVVLSASLDGARAASLTLDWLEQNGHLRLAKASVAVVNQQRSRPGAVDVERVTDHFAARCRATLVIPWDAHLAAGVTSDLDELAALTRDRYLELAALVADGFRSESP